MDRFAWIPAELICRFGELTKTEIIVLTYLYLSRNQKTGQCNPSRAAIGRAVGVAKSHVSKAVGGLEDKEWICEMPDGNFLLTEPGEKVTKTVTPKVTESVTQGLRNPSPKVTKSVTKGYENGNHHIRIEQTRNNELNIGGDITPAVAIYFETFPTQSINLWQQDCITDRISDLEKWRRAAVLWKTNGWNARNVANLLDYYDKLDEREKKYGANSKHRKPSNPETIQQSADYFKRKYGDVTG